jgi:hypothetical protein
MEMINSLEKRFVKLLVDNILAVQALEIAGTLHTLRLGMDDQTDSIAPRVLESLNYEDRLGIVRHLFDRVLFQVFYLLDCNINNQGIDISLMATEELSFNHRFAEHYRDIVDPGGRLHLPLN